MTTAKKADQAAAKKSSGQGEEVSNAEGTSTGPGSSSASGTKRDNQRSIAGAGSAKAARSRPGHKTGG